MTGSRNFLFALAAVVIVPFLLVLLPGGSPRLPDLSAATMAPAAISTEEAANRDGSVATVEGLVRNVHTARSGKATFIDLASIPTIRFPPLSSRTIWTAWAMSAICKGARWISPAR